MSKGLNLDGVLLTWGDRLFYPGNRMVRARAQPKLGTGAGSQRAAEIRRRIEATVLRRAPQVIVKVTGGGRCVRAIAAHFRYISKNGRLDVEDELGEKVRGPSAVRDLAEEWQYGGSLIPDEAEANFRREAFNIMLSMPRGTDPLAVQQAARGFARSELADHKYVMVLHDHQANPHVHISVRAESKHGKRLSPRKADLHRWRGTFAENLRDLGIEAEASRRFTRQVKRYNEPLWQLKAREERRLHRVVSPAMRSAPAESVSSESTKCWTHIARALAETGSQLDDRLAIAILDFLAVNGGGTNLDRSTHRTQAFAPVDGPTRTR